MKTRLASLALAALVVVGAGSLTACTPNPKVVQAAHAQIGQSYRTGGESRAEGGFDCSGLTYYAWRQAGKTLPRTSSAQYAGTARIAKAALRAGDLVFYSSAGRGGRVSHVALYVGNGKIVQARKPGVPIAEADLNTWWVDHLVGYGRVK